MHLELPKVPLVRFNDFAKHYLMIVLSILTALGLEAWIEHTHHASAAESASRQIEAELRANLGDIDQSFKTNQHSMRPLKEIDEAITKDIRAGIPKVVINQHIQTLKKQFQLILDWPQLTNQAWDVAVANQSVTWISAPDLRRYSMAYTAQRSANDWVAHSSLTVLNATRMTELQTQLDLGVDVDPVEFDSILRQMIDTIRETQGQLTQMRSSLLKALSTSSDTTSSSAAH